MSLSVCVCVGFGVYCVASCVLFVCVCASISWAILPLIKTDASQAVKWDTRSIRHPTTTSPPRETEMGEEEKQVQK